MNSVFGPVKFEASMEYPSEKAHGVIISVVFGAQIRGLLRNIDLRSISYEEGGGEGRVGWCQSPEEKEILIPLGWES